MAGKVFGVLLVDLQQCRKFVTTFFGVSVISNMIKMFNVTKVIILIRDISVNLWQTVQKKIYIERNNVKAITEYDWAYSFHIYHA